MNRGVFVLWNLLLRWVREYRDARIRFLREENRILRSRLGRQRLILSPEERSRLLAIGARLEYQVKGLATVARFRAYPRSGEACFNDSGRLTSIIFGIYCFWFILSLIKY